MRKLWPIVFASAVLLASGEPGIASPAGTWLAKDGSTIRISTCGRGFCGFVAKTNPRHDPDTGRSWKDKFNIDLAKRERHVIGIQLLNSMKPNGPGNWSGHLYNVDDGKTYPGNLVELTPSSIRVEGCSLGVCGGEELTRLK